MAQVQFRNEKRESAAGVTPSPVSSSESIANASIAEKRTTLSVLIFFMGIIIIALVACLMYQHTAYTQIKRHDITNSADDLNGQSPANTTLPAVNATQPAAQSSSAPASANTPPSTPANSTTPAAGASKAPVTNTPAATVSAHSAQPAR